jgi:hypothetical protein
MFLLLATFRKLSTTLLNLANKANQSLAIQVRLLSFMAATVRIAAGNFYGKRWQASQACQTCREETAAIPPFLR